LDDIVKDFVAEALEAIEALDGKMVTLEQDPEDPVLLGDIFRLIHTIKGTSGFLGLMRLQTVAHAAENVLGGFRDNSLSVDGSSVSAILEVVDVVRDIVHGIASEGTEPTGDDAALIARLDAIFAGGRAGRAAEARSERPLIERLGGDATIDAACEAAMQSLGSDPEISPLLAGLDPDRLQAALRDALCAAARGAGLSEGLLPVLAAQMPGVSETQTGRWIAELKVSLLALDAEAEAVEALLVPPPAADDKASRAVRPPASETDPASQTIRVNVDTLENLMAVVSELVLIRNQLIQTLRSEPESAFAGPLHRLNQVTSELQEGVMTTRMQPINGVLAKLPRLVRDLAADLDKKIELVISGQDTELDRQVLEMIKDPLTHMIRNAADHGIERPDQRRAAGKSETGRITLQARHDGGAIVVEMADDGRGLPAEAIRKKALGAGVITASQAATMTDAEARQLIFLPGLSTATEVTSVSGRGVGMDVVRTNIEKIGGSIELSSVEGQGTRFTIRIPLTLSIVSALIIECCGERFAMPQGSIVELVSANGSEGRRIETINGASVLRLRDRLLPLVSLGDLLGLEDPEEARADACIVVARVGSFSFGVIVDRVFDTEEIVVKPVASVLRHLKLYSGATILGDGSVIMILDFKGISLEAGAAHLLSGGDEAELATEAATSAETRTLLVFRNGEDSLRAAPLTRVARIEDLDCGAVERADGRSVIQYRGGLMPIVGGDGALVTAMPGERRPLLVFTRGEASLGLLAEEIIDIVEGPLDAQLAGVRGGAGSVIVAGRATELVDIDACWRAVGVETDGTDPLSTTIAQPANPSPPAALPPLSEALKTRSQRRVLVVDQSPFTQLLLAPLLAQAGYVVEVARGPGDALALHDVGETYDLILADTTPSGDTARRLADAFGRASSWHRTPLLGLGAYRADAAGGADDFAGALDRESLLSAMDASLSPSEPLKGAA
jgi:two-component system chemotaxis sensor kinase CheA